MITSDSNQRSDQIKEEWLIGSKGFYASVRSRRRRIVLRMWSAFII
jgi:hypothetical protein